MADDFEYVFRKDIWGNWQFVKQQKSSDIGCILIIIMVLVVLLLVLITITTLPFWLAMLGFTMMIGKRHYAGIISLLSLIYFYFDIKNRWISGYLFLGYTDSSGISQSGFLGAEAMQYVYMANVTGLVFALIFIAESYIISNGTGSRNNSYAKGFPPFVFVIAALMAAGITYLAYPKVAAFASNVPNPIVELPAKQSEDQELSNNETFSPASDVVEDLPKEYNSDQNEFSSTEEEINPNNISGEEASDDQVYMEVEEMPEFPGGQEGLLKYLASITYPPIARENDIEGTVYIRFIIDKGGQVTDVEVARGADKILNEAALGHVKKMPAWKPGKQREKHVKVQYVLPIMFSLS
jgi:TonB family protein